MYTVFTMITSELAQKTDVPTKYKKEVLNNHKSIFIEKGKGGTETKVEINLIMYITELLKKYLLQNC